VYANKECSSQYGRPGTIDTPQNLKPGSLGSPNGQQQAFLDH